MKFMFFHGLNWRKNMEQLIKKAVNNCFILLNTCKNYIMRKLLYTVIVSATALLCSCEAVSDSEIILFDGVNKIAFVDDSVRVNIAELPIKDIHTVKLPVRIMGFIDYEKARPFEVEVLKGVSNGAYSEPISGEQYIALPANYTIEKDSINGFVEVEFSSADFDTDKIYELRLRIKPNNYFQFGVVEKLESKIITLNFLEKPTWWDTAGLTSDFQVLMLSKLFEVVGKSPITEDMVWNDYMGIMAAFKKVSDWLDENPQYGVSFNEKDKEYFSWFV